MMRFNVKKRLILRVFISFMVFSLVFLFYSTQSTHKKAVPQSNVVSKVSLGSPVRLVIPVINVDANIQHIGVTPKGEMEVPNNTTDGGWFKLGPRPGEKGSAVIGGHFNGKNGEKGVFANLYKLKVGDTLYVKDDKGVTLAFTVREKRMYDPGYADEVFSGNTGVHLNLITCDGVWDEAKKSYSKRLVVFADILD